MAMQLIPTGLLEGRLESGRRKEMSAPDKQRLRGG